MLVAVGVIEGIIFLKKYSFKKNYADYLEEIQLVVLLPRIEITITIILEALKEETIKIWVTVDIMMIITAGT